jgi:anti-anti-sigma regulatory factor
MLKITLRDSVDRMQFELEGRLTGAWVPELEGCWRASAPSLGGRELWIDLRAVDSIDDAGRRLLALMHESGARFLACGCMTAAVVEEITGQRPVGRYA